MTRWVYDIETYPNVFIGNFINVNTRERVGFKTCSNNMSDDEIIAIIDKMINWYMAQELFIGFNNIGFDAIVISQMRTWRATPLSGSQLISSASSFGQTIIRGMTDEERRTLMYRTDSLVQQCDLMRVQHYDNPSRRCSLKQIKFAMRRTNLQDLPIPPNTHVPVNMLDKLDDYCWDDVETTLALYEAIQSNIQFRETMTKELGVDLWSASNTKIGVTIIRKEVESALGKGAIRKADGQPVQTPDRPIKLGDIIFPYLSMETAPFHAVQDWMREQVITTPKNAFTLINPERMVSHPITEFTDAKKTKGLLKNLNVNNYGLNWVFGSGGIHASRNNITYRSSDTMTILDIDVSSFYPNLAINNNFYPSHLSSSFNDIYKSLYEKRKLHASGTNLNLALKEALNAVFGNSNNAFSFLKDSSYFFKTTINGQFSLAKLTEMVMQSVDCEIIQGNTDGVTFYINRKNEDIIRDVASEWERMTKLKLEFAEYDLMAISDVNNYIARTVSGKVKAKGRYQTSYNSSEYHKNQSELIVAKAALAYMVDDIPIEYTVYTADNIYDFMRFVRLNKDQRLLTGDGIELAKHQRIIISTEGVTLKKEMQPLNNNDLRYTSIPAGYTIIPCNDMTQWDEGELLLRVNRQYYAQAASSIINKLGVDLCK